MKKLALNSIKNVFLLPCYLKKYICGVIESRFSMLKKRRKKQWFRLDNAAKIFPPTSDKKDPRVFRFTCEFYAKIDPQILSHALEKNLKLFPGFSVILKKGFFWYYLEETEQIVKITEENIPPCSPIYDKNRKKPLFRIQYYQNRINLEIYHALTDGTGALEFFKSLASFYIIEKEKLNIENPLLDYDASVTEQMKDSFQKYYQKPYKKIKNKRPIAYQFHGERLKEHQIRMIEGHLQVDQILTLAHQYQTTVTVLITAIFMKAIELEMSIKERKKPVTIMIPINLRKYFDSATIRNFFSICYTTYQFKKNETQLKEIIKVVDNALKKELKQEAIEQTVNQLVAFEKNPIIRITPIFLKDFVLKTITEISNKDNTAVISNMGTIDMPESLQSYIKRFHAFVYTSKKQICLCSYQNQLSIGFTSAFVSTDIEKNFFRLLTSLGLNVEIATNSLDEEVL